MSKKYREIHEKAIVDFDRIQSNLYQERKQCLEDRRFYSIAGAQWEGSVGDQFENKPRFEVNKIHLAVMRIINEYRNNRISVDFVPKDGTTNSQLADTCNGLYRADEEDSTSEEAYDNAFEEAAGGGFGAYRMTTEYEDEYDDENEKQRIRIEPIYDADSSVFFDMDAKRQDKSDAKYCYVMYSMTPEDYEMEYGKEAKKNISSVNKTIQYVEYDWYTPDVVYIAEYYRVEIKKETVKIYQTLTGDEERYTEQDFEDDPDLERKLEASGAQEVRQKKVKRKKVHKYIISGNEILEDCGYIAGKNIPIIPVYGKRWFVDSVERCMGHVRLAKDTQRLKNMLMSKLAEISSLSSISKPIFTPEQVSQHAIMWAEDTIKNFPYLLVDPITNADGQEQAAGPIAYTKSPEVPQALAALMQLVDIDTKELLGGQMEADKMLSHVSGKAHELLQKRIDSQAFIYMSNFARAIQRGGEIWLSMAREVYVEKGRKMKTIDSMEQVSSVELMKPVSGPAGIEEENDLTKATFDVAVEVGPSSSSQREAALTSIIGMMQVVQDPETAQVLQAMAMMNMEGEGLGEAREFFRKKLVNMGVVKPTPEEAKAMQEAMANQQPSPQDQLFAATAAKEAAQAKKLEADTVKVASEVELNNSKTAKNYSDINVDKARVVQDAFKTPNAN